MDKTKIYKKRYLFFTILGIILTLAPLIVYTIIAFANGSASERFVLGITLLFALGITAANFIFKYSLRSGIWILLLGLAYAMSSITEIVLIVAICTIIDEFVCQYFAKKYKNLYIINREIDKRTE